MRRRASVGSPGVTKHRNWEHKTVKLYSLVSNRNSWLVAKGKFRVDAEESVLKPEEASTTDCEPPC